MRYSKEAINKYAAKMRDMINQYIAIGDGLSVCISAGNVKIGRVMNVSTAPLFACGNCKECMHYCYDIKANLQYSNVLSARARNYVLAKFHRDEYFRQIRNALAKRRKNKYFRWHVAGDILDMAYLEEMVKIAREFPEFTFWTYTKMYPIVNSFCRKNGGRDAIPANLSIMFSEWDGMPIYNPYGFGVFSCKLQDGNKNHTPEYFDGLYKCPGNCDICKAAGRGCLINENTYADEH